MEVEDSDVRKSRGRRSRNNSSNSKDSKSDSVREANGSEGKQSKVSNLPNGDEALDGIKKSKESSGNKGAEDKENHTESKSNNSSSSESEVEKDCVSNSEATNGDVMVKTVSKHQASSSDSEDEFKGFHIDKIPEDPGVYAVNQLMAKLQSDDFISEDELDDDDREFILQYRSAMTGSSWTDTNSPNKMDGLNDSLVTDDVCSSNASSPSVASGFSGDAKPRGKKSHIDVTNPAYLKPFSVGWKRELVFRNMLDTSQKRMADVYYYTPSGKKVRSARELGEHLIGTDLTEENFTFFKTPLGLNDPTKELIRDAKRGPVRDSSGTPPHKIPKIVKTPKLDGTKVSLLTKEEVGSPKPLKSFSRGVFPRIRVTPSKGNQHISPSRPKVQGRPKKEPLPEGELEMGMLPPSWKEPSAVSNARKTSPAATAHGRSSSQPLMNAGSLVGKEDGFIGMPVPSDNHYMQFFMQNLSVGYTALHHVFQFLKVHELLRAARVCRMWHDLAGHPSLWKTVRMKNSQVLDWDGCAAMLSRHGTQHLDLRKMLFDTSKSQEVWNQFCSAIGRISSLRHLDLCRCPASVVERVSSQCPQLTNLIALFVHDQNLDLKPLMSMYNLEELRIKGQSGLKLKSPLDVLSKMKSLRHLSLTSVRDMGKSCPEALKSLTQLDSLELGECSDFSEEFGTECLPRLTKLTRLRLEMGQGKCPTFSILSAGVQSIPSLTHLELINFDIKAGFDEALATCSNLRRLLIIPTYLTQSATTNHMVLSGVIKLENLVQFVWGVTHELLHVTELFMDQCDQKGNTANSANATNSANAANSGNVANSANAVNSANAANTANAANIANTAGVANTANTPKGAAAGSTGSVPGPGNVLQQLPVGKKVTTGDSIPILRPVPGRDVLGAEEEIVLDEDESKPSPQVDILRLSQLQRLLNINLPKTVITILKIPYSATWRQSLGETNV